MRIIDDEDWLVEDASDAEDSSVDSEDSNAEGFHTHEYPEDEFGSESADAQRDVSEANSEVRAKRGRPFLLCMCSMRAQSLDASQLQLVK